MYSVTSLEQAYATYDYTDNGQQRTVIDANGNRARLEYDGHDRLQRWRFPSKTKPSSYNDASHASALSSAGAVSSNDYEAYTHDANGNRLTLRKRDGRTISYQYDDLNRMTAKIIPNGSGLASTHTRNVYYGYDLRGLQTYARFDSHGGGDGIQTSYDGFGRVASSNNTMGGWNKTLSYRYDRNSNRTRITHADGNYFTTSYDQLDRQFDTNENGGNRISAYRYHGRGVFAYNHRTAGLQNRHNYDAAGRLSRLRFFKPGGTDNADFRFAYTPSGQIKSRTLDNDNYANTAHYDVNRAYQVNGLNQYTSAGGASFTHDANGNLTSDGSVTFIYDVENRLVQAMGAKQATLTYDPMGRLWEVNPGTGAANITRFLYDGDALVGEYDGPGNLTDRYVHGVGADVPTQWYEGSAVNSSTRRHLFANWQGSIALITNTTGNTVNINAYDAYGIANETNIGRFQYTGQIAIPELGLYHYKARVYSPTLGRFLQTDPIGYEDQVNLYAYVGNDPVNLIDPTGLSRLGNESNLRGFSAVNNMIGAGNSPFEQGGSQAVGPAHAQSGSHNGENYEGRLNNTRPSPRRNPRGRGNGLLQPLITARYNVVYSQVEILVPGYASARSMGPPSMEALRTITATRDAALRDWAQTAFRPDTNGFTAAGRSFQKHSSRGEFIRSGPNTASNFNAQGQAVVNAIVSSPSVRVRVTPNGQTVKVSAPGIGTIGFTRSGTFRFIDNQ